MRKLTLLTLAAGMVWAQAPSCQAQQTAVDRAEALLQAGAMPQRDLQTARMALALCRLQQQLTEEMQRKREEYLAANGAIPPQPPGDSPKIALPDRWWKNSVTSQYLGLTGDQQRKMDDVLQQFRSRLTTANLELQRQELGMEPLVSAEPLDEAKITAQIDRVAEARAELEKTNGRMLLGIRRLLTPDQWVKLNQAFTLSLTQK
jgi:Spy/CpxP family protein refolding chaperone